MDVYFMSKKERESYWSGEWVAANGPRCSPCGCLLDNHRTDGTCVVCSCKGVT